MKITIHGAGYVGLIAGLCFADKGNDVIVVDINENKIGQLQNAQCPIYEKGLQELLNRNLVENRIEFTTDIKPAVEHGFLQFIAVGTPEADDGNVNLAYVYKVAENIAAHMTSDVIVINKSTAPIGTIQQIRTIIQKRLDAENKPIKFSAALNPEFLRQGQAVHDFMFPERIIIGVDDDASKDHLLTLYHAFKNDNNQIIVMDTQSAALTKYAANAMLATKISFMNELSHIAKGLGADIELVKQGMGSDPRIGPHFISPGCGYGGSCFPKDVIGLIKMAESLALKPKLIQAVHDVNDHQRHYLFEMIQQHFKQTLKGKTFALWGLAFKPETDDMREAPSRYLIDALLASGARIQAFDPIAIPTAKKLYGNHDELIFCDNPEKCFEGAAALIIVTEWEIFKQFNFQNVKDSQKPRVVFDGRNLYNPDDMRALGISYHSIGRF